MQSPKCSAENSTLPCGPSISLASETAWIALARTSSGVLRRTFSMVKGLSAMKVWTRGQGASLTERAASSMSWSTARASELTTVRGATSAAIFARWRQALKSICEAPAKPTSTPWTPSFSSWRKTISFWARSQGLRNAWLPSRRVTS